jgi:predicted  nucleic acid-binding Zn-ribbon protein
MKLLFCTNCRDVFNLRSEEKRCGCGNVKGRYVNDNDAIYSGDTAIALGFSNTSLNVAVRSPGNFDAFVFKSGSPTFKKVK